MQKVGSQLLKHLRQPPYRPLNLRWLVEVYNASTDPSVLCEYTKPTGPAKAIARWTYGQCTYWNGLKYEPRLAGEPPTVNKFFGREINNADLSLKNLDLYATRFILGNRVEGLYGVIRLVSPDAGTDYAILFAGRFERPGVISTLSGSLSLRAFYGGLEREAPFRAYGPGCPLDFGRGECLGNQTLVQKSQLYQIALKTDGESGCNKTYDRCRQLGNLNFYQGIKLVALSGSYQFVEKTKSRFLFFFSRTKKVTKTAQFTSTEGADLDKKVPLAWGRVAIGPLHVMQSAERATDLIALLGVADGEQTALLKATSHSTVYPIATATFHPGAYGGESGQEISTLFPGSPAFSRLAYIEATFSGATPDTGDSLPETSAVILARKLKSPDSATTLAYGATSDNPVWTVRDILTAPRLGNLPECLIDDTEARKTANLCAALVIDASGSNLAIDPAIPSGEDKPPRYAITGTIKFLNTELDLSGLNPTDANVEPDLVAEAVTPPQILRKRMTYNGILTDNAKLTDFLQKSVLPTARLFLLTSAEGKVQIKQEGPVDNCFLRQATQSGTNTLPVTNALPWTLDQSGWLLAGVGTMQAEVAKVINVTWSDSQNTVPIVVEAQGGITVSVPSPTLTGGSEISPARSFITVSGVAEVNSSITLTLDNIKVTAYPEAGATGKDLTSLLAAWVNAHPSLQQQYSADWVEAGVTITSLAGHLILDRQLANAHDVGSECLRAAYVFSNCGTAGTSDNVLKDSFKWNTSDSKTSVNATKGTFTSAVNGFARWELTRKARTHIEETGGESSYELDLHGVDSFAQATDILRSKLVELRDADLKFTWASAAGETLLLEEGDVVILQNRSFGLTIPALPARLRKATFGPAKSEFQGQLYLSSQYVYPSLAVADSPAISTVTTPSTGTGTGTINNGDGFTDLNCTRYTSGGDNFYGTGLPTTDNCGRDLS